jgi:NADH dehydrogenase
VHVQSTVRQLTPEAVNVEPEAIIATWTAVRTVGVRADLGIEQWGLPTARNGPVTVPPGPCVERYQEVYAIGDLPYLVEDARPLPMMAPVAIQQRVAAAKDIFRQAAG